MTNSPSLKRRPERVQPRLIALEALAMLLFILFMVPFIIVVFDAAKTSKEIIYNPIGLPEDWSQMWRNIVAIFSNPSTDYFGAFVDSTVVTLISLVVIVIFSSMCAWVLCRNKAWWSTMLFMMFVAAMVIPFQVVMFPLVRWFKIMQDFVGSLFPGFKLLDSYQGIAFAYLGFGSSMTIFILHGFIKGIPLELEEAATIDGCGKASTFFKIVLPLLQPVMVTVIILNGIWIWNDFLLPLLVLSSRGSVQTIPLAVIAFAGSFLKQWDLILTSAMLAMLPVIVLFIFAQKYIIKGMVEGSIK